VTRAVICDVCDTSYSLDDSEGFIALTLPGVLFSEKGSTDLDVCSPTCLKQVADALLTPDPEPEYLDGVQDDNEVEIHPYPEVTVR
jgi:hypothetical protein